MPCFLWTYVLLDCFLFSLCALLVLSALPFCPGGVMTLQPTAMPCTVHFLRPLSASLTISFASVVVMPHLSTPPMDSAPTPTATLTMLVLSVALYTPVTFGFLCWTEYYPCLLQPSCVSHCCHDNALSFAIPYRTSPETWGCSECAVESQEMAEREEADCRRHHRCRPAASCFGHGLSLLSTGVPPTCL